MKVYLATAGEYSDYRVMHVFARREDAEAYELADDVEEYEVNDGPVGVRTWHILMWDSAVVDRAADDVRSANPHEWTDRRDFDGRINRVEHRWDGHLNGPRLVVQGWDLERVRKVYSEQRAQHVARQDMGVEPDGTARPKRGRP